MRATQIVWVLAALGALLVGSCSRAHEPDDGASGSDGSSVDSSIDGSPEDSAPTDSDSPPPDAEEVDCPSTCLSTCGSGTLECRCSVGGDWGRCAGYVVHCPTGIRPPECTGTGGIHCSSLVPGGGAEPATCVRDTAPERWNPDCVPACNWDGDLGCADSRGAGLCEGYVVECPTADSPPVCVEYGVRCTLPDGSLERPICVRG